MGAPVGVPGSVFGSTPGFFGGSGFGIAGMYYSGLRGANYSPSMAATIAGHIASAEVNAAIEMGGFATSGDPMIGQSPAVSESSGGPRDDRGSGPRVATMPVPQTYPSGWKWYHNPFSSYGDSNQPHGWWTPAAWTTDPSLAVPVPTYKGNKRGRHGSGGPG